MGPPADGFVLLFDVRPFDGPWVLLPGLLLLGSALGLLALAARPGARRGRLQGAAGGLLLLAVWWTLGGTGAWRMGAERLATGTADYVEGPLNAVAWTSGGTMAFSVGGVRLSRTWDAFLPALHAGPWPSVPLSVGQPVRVWFFGGDVLRLEARPGP